MKSVIHARATRSSPPSGRRWSRCAVGRNRSWLPHGFYAEELARPKGESEPVVRPLLRLHHEIDGHGIRRRARPSDDPYGCGPRNRLTCGMALSGVHQAIAYKAMTTNATTSTATTGCEWLHVPEVAGEYNIPEATLYGWRNGAWAHRLSVLGGGLCTAGPTSKTGSASRSWLNARESRRFDAVQHPGQQGHGGEEDASPPPRPSGSPSTPPAPWPRPQLAALARGRTPRCSSSRWICTGFDVAAQGPRVL